MRCATGLDYQRIRAPIARSLAARSHRTEPDLHMHFLRLVSRATWAVIEQQYAAADWNLEDDIREEYTALSELSAMRRVR